MANDVLHINPSPKDFGKEWTKLQGTSRMSSEVLKKYFASLCVPIRVHFGTGWSQWLITVFVEK